MIIEAHFKVGPGVPELGKRLANAEGFHPLECGSGVIRVILDTQSRQVEPKLSVFRGMAVGRRHGYNTCGKLVEFLEGLIHSHVVCQVIGIDAKVGAAIVVQTGQVLSPY